MANSENQGDSQEAEKPQNSPLSAYESEVMARVPFSDYEVVTESFHDKENEDSRLKRK